MTIEKYRFVGEGDDRGNLHLIAILNLEILQCLVHAFLVIGFRNVKRQHRATLMRLQTFHIDVPQCTGGQNSAGQFKHLRQSLLAFQLIHRRPLYHALDLDLWPERQEVIDIHFLHDVLSSIVLKCAQ